MWQVQLNMVFCFFEKLGIIFWGWAIWKCTQDWTLEADVMAGLTATYSPTLVKVPLNLSLNHCECSWLGYKFRRVCLILSDSRVKWVKDRDLCFYNTRNIQLCIPNRFCCSIVRCDLGINAPMPCLLRVSCMLHQYASRLTSSCVFGTVYWVESRAT
jgi:hypothetical protein